MSLKSDLAAWLPQQAAIAAIVVARVYQFPAPQDAASPFLALQRGATTDDYVLAGTRTGLPTTMVQVDCWGGRDDAGRTAARQLADAVRDALAGFRGVIGTTRVQHARLESDSPDYDDQLRQFAVRLDFAITFEE